MFWGMYYKTLRIFLREMNKLHTKLVRMSKPVKVTDNNKDTLVSYATKFFTAITTFIVQAFGLPHQILKLD
jgi:hypothetical protein